MPNLFTDEEARMIRDNMPVMGDRPPGVDIVEKIEGVSTAGGAAQAAADVAQADVDAIVSGVGTILNGTTSIAVTVGAAFNGKRAVVSMAEAPTAAALVWAGVVAGGDLTLNCDVDNTASLDVNYVLDGR
tara:strand:- start:8590 stop:8979 length:390 start_codon:yes stop_codon:yes gene_type:complete